MEYHRSLLILCLNFLFWSLILAVWLIGAFIIVLTIFSKFILRCFVIISVFAFSLKSSLFLTPFQISINNQSTKISSSTQKQNLTFRRFILKMTPQRIMWMTRWSHSILVPPKISSLRIPTPMSIFLKGKDLQPHYGGCARYDLTYYNN